MLEKVLDRALNKKFYGAAIAALICWATCKTRGS